MSRKGSLRGLQVTLVLLSCSTVSALLTPTSLIQRDLFSLTYSSKVNLHNNIRLHKKSYSHPIISRLSMSSEDNNEEKEKSELDKSMWFDTSPFVKNISLPNILFGSLLGALVAFGTIFAPLFLPEDVPAGVTVVSAGVADKNVDKSKAIKDTVMLFEDVLEDLQAGYVDEVNPNKLFETAVSAMLKSLDPYTEFENLGAAKNMLESVSGKYGGVGLIISGSKEKVTPVGPLKKDPKPAAVGVAPDNDKSEIVGVKGVPKLPSFGVTIVDAFEGYGFDAGLRVGDRLVTVGGVDATQMNVEQVRDLLRGDPDTDVKIVFDREESTYTIKSETAASKKEPLETVDASIVLGGNALPTASPASANLIRQEVSIKRSLVRMSDIRLATFLGDPKDGLGYINLSGFNSGAGRDFRQAMVMLRYSSPVDLKGLILDLRGNPGGLLDAAVEIASYLVPSKSEIVSAKSRNGEEVVYKSVIDPIRPAGMKLAVMVNGGSASASEIVAGAVQDLDAGIIVGPDKTYGKGLVQKITPLPYDNALKYTIAKYYTPSGRCIQRIGYTGGRDAIVAKADTGIMDEKAAKEANEGVINDIKNKELNKNNEDIKDKKDKKNVNEEKTSKLNKRGRNVYENIDPRFMEAGMKNENMKSDKDTLYALLDEDNENYNMQGESQSGPTLSYDDRPKKKKTLPENKIPSSPDGAYEYADADRKTFYTRAGRPVKDAGGIEVDLKTVPLIPGPAETIFLTQGVYFDFASDYLTTHNVRPILREEAAAERKARDADERFITGLKGGSLSQYFVLLEPILGGSSNREDSALPISTASSTSIPLSAVSMKDKEIRLTNAVLQPSGSVAPPVVGPISNYDKKVKNIFWDNVDNSDYNDKTRKTKNIYKSKEDRRNDMYSEFKTYVEKRISKGELNVEAGLGSKFDNLERDLTSDGLESVADSIELLRPKIKQSIIADMDKNREFVINDIEITILSRELPDRLLLFRNVITDPQVGKAVDILKSSIANSDVNSNNIHTTCVTTEKTDLGIANCINDKILTSAQVTNNDQYDTLLSSPRAPTADTAAK
mmetsp:Transcript_19059/g.18390  ORF Transcript_19059/g.18390 Transcript_19059/m.18390 type:complete len:1062 (-) Transcript_19059:391-3576(-)|eukprot:CAMPEP_0119038086 /NCGR_PEP_ID=MMETSP1177-20130426/6793_1 /TAXON_ID=2985 /ORGANISM="Ochromonas sp, Strain CCMP1899" /LENGTH=1061 /DNA_ID=CAMNT_0007000207 /DNA_START=121 /DNA_END=3306 /DNA_ORIENTATION=+